MTQINTATPHTITIAEIQSLVQLQLGLRHVEAADRFMEDLGAESVDLLNIIAQVEDQYSISFDVAEISNVRTSLELYDLIIQTTYRQNSSFS